MKKILPILIALIASFNSFSQNVGIGTNTPASRLSIEGSDNSTQTKNAVIQLANTASGANNNWYLRAGATGTLTPAGGFSIGDKISNRLIVDSTGNVGIGMNPSMTLDVIRGSGTGGTARFAGTNYPTQFNYGVAENTYINGGLAGSHIMLNFFGGGNVGVGQGLVPVSTFEVGRGSGNSTALFRGSTYQSIFNAGSNEDTYIRGGKTGANVYINDANSGHVVIGNATPQATFTVSKNSAHLAAAIFYGSGSGFINSFNSGANEDTYLSGGKANANVLINTVTGAGNVGIGIISPMAELDVARGFAPFGTAAFRGTNNSSFFNYGNTEDTYLRGGKNLSHIYLNDTTDGGIRIGGSDIPLAKLDVSKAANFFGSANFRGTTYHSYFHYGNTEDTYIRGGIANSNVTINDQTGGKVGIGLPPTITDGVLDVNGRMRIRSGGDIGHTAGIWLNKTNNSSLATFIGMEDDEHVGFYGLPAGFKFAMNTTTGALKINGSEGNAGEVLTSNGSGSAPAWKSGPGSLFANSVSYAQGAAVSINCVNCFATMITAPSAPLIITKNSKILLSYSGLIEPQSTSPLAPDSRVNINLSIVAEDGTVIISDNYKTIGYRNWGGTGFSKTTNLLYLVPGNYYMILQATLIDGMATQLKNGIITTVVMQE